MKLQSILIVSIFQLMFSFLFAQKYEKSYQQNINYKTNNNNGKDLNLNFACKYDAFLGEPLFSSRTKKISEGDFIVYNNQKYYRKDIGDKIFNQVEVGLINVSFDIYQGSRKITTVKLENEISVSFIPGSPDWDQLWPGVSEENVKKIWKEGYTIKNAKLYNVKFTGFSALQNYLNKIESDKAKEIEDKKKAEEKEKEEQEKADQEQQLKEEEEAEKLIEENKKQEEEDLERAKEEEREKAAAAEAERKRREEQERIRQEKINAYNNRIANQKKENNAIAAASAASSASILYLLGGVIYNKMGLPGKDLYTGNNFHINFDFGYGVSAFPLSYNSVRTAVDYNGDEQTTEEETTVSAITVDLRLAFKVGYEVENGGGNIYGRFEPGFSPIFTDFNTSHGYGAEIFGGHKNIKLYGRYEMGTHSFSSNNWIDPEEIGEGGKSSTSYTQLRAGLKFSYYRNTRTAKRDHIILGIMENYFDENSAEVFSFREEPGEPLINLNGNIPNYVASGFFFEWKRDHTHRLYLEVFSNYPSTGEIGGVSNDGSMFLQVGFSRSIEGFFGNK